MNDFPPYRKPTSAEFDAAAAMSIAQRHKRVAPVRSRLAAINDLHEKLVKYAELYETEQLQNKRDAVSASLMAVQECLYSIGFSLATLAPIMRPVLTLVERENNKRDPLFCASARTGRPKGSIAKETRTGVLAAFAEYWLIHHNTDQVKQNIALSRLSRVLVGKWFVKVTNVELKAARDLVMQEGKDHVAVRSAHFTAQRLQTAAQQFGTESAVSILVRFMNDLPESVGT